MPTPESSVLMIGPSGAIESVPESEVPGAKSSGYFLATPEQIAQRDAVKRRGEFHPAEMLGAFGAEAARVATFGASDIGLTRAGVDPATLRKLRDENPVSNFAGTVAGVALPALATAGLGAAPAAGSAAATAARLAPTALVGAAGRAAGAATGRALTGAAVPRLVAKAAEFGVGSMVEGAFFGAGHVVSEAALGDAQLTAESVISDIGLSAALGLGLGAAGGVVAEGVPRLAGMANDFVARKSSSLRDAFVEKYPALASQLTGKSENEVRFLLENRNIIWRSGEAKKFAQKEFATVLQGLEDEVTVISKQLNKAAPTERAALAARGLSDEAVDGEVSRLVEGARAAAAKMEAEPLLHSEAYRRALAKLTDEFEQVIRPSTEKVRERLLTLGERITADPAVVEYALPNPATRRALVALGDLAESLPGLPQTEFKAAQTELGRIASALPKKYTKELRAISEGLSAVQVTPAAKLQATIDFKKRLDDVLPYGADKLGMGVDVKNAVGVIQGVVGDVRSSLHQSPVWGEVANRMAAVDLLNHELINARKALRKGGSAVFEKTVGSGAYATYKVSPTKVETWLNQVGSLRDDARAEHLAEYMDRAKALVNEYHQSVSHVPTTARGTSELSSLIDKTGRVVQDVRQQAEATKLLKEMREPGMEASVLAGVAKPALGSLLGPAGTAVGALHAIYGFTKNVPAVVNTLSALERSSVRTQRAITVAASTIARGSEKAFYVGRGEAAAGMAKVFGLSPEKMEQRFASVSGQLERLRNPALLQRVLDAQAAGLDGAPQTAQNLQTTTSMAISFLNSKLPRPEFSGMLGTPRQLSTAEMAKFMRYYSAVEDPHSVLKQIASGTLTPEAVEAVRTVYPSFYAATVLELHSQISRNPSRVPYQTKMMLSMYFGEDVDRTTRSSGIQMNQMVYAPKPKVGRPPTAGGGKLTVSERTLPATSAVVTRGADK